MTYEEFKGELYRFIMQQEMNESKKIMLLEKGFTSHDPQLLSMIRYINKVTAGKEDNIVRTDYIYVIWGEGHVRGMMNWGVRELYEKYRKSSWEGVLPELLLKIKNAGQSMEWLKLDRGGYEKCRNRLILRPINFERNKYELENCIYKRYGDIALTLYGLVADEEDDYVTMKITRSLIEEWDVGDKTLLEDALRNTCAMMPPRLFYCTDLKKKHDCREGIFMPEELTAQDTPFCVNSENELEGSLGYRLTTTRGINGAIALFYPGVRERLAEMMGGDFLIGFTSIHEAILHPAAHQRAENMRESIKDINAVFPKEEMLSNQVFRYDAVTGELLELG